MALDHFASVLLALSAVTTAVASAGLATALGILAFEFARLARRPQLVTYEFALPADPPPAAELFFAYVHALLRSARSHVVPSPPVVVAVHGSDAGLRLRVTADERNARRLTATLGTIWPGASLVRVSPRTPRCESVEWGPRVEDSRSRDSFAGAQPTLARALARAEAGAELWYELVLRPAVPRTRRPIWDLRPTPARSTRTTAHGRGSDRRDPGQFFHCRLAIRAHASSDRHAYALLDELEPSVHVLTAGTAIDLGPARHGTRVRPRLARFASGELGPRELAILFPLASLAAVAAATATQNAMSGERLLGLRMVGNTEQEVRLSLSASRHHLHVLGPTGTGKSTLLLNLVAQDIAAGRGCAVLDPKGDLIRDLLERIPRSRLSDVMYIGPDERTRAVGINPLALGAGEDPYLAAENALSIFKRIYEENWGPRTDDILKACLLTLVAVPGTTIAHIPALLTNTALRRRLTAHVEDAVGVGSFWRWYEGLSEARRHEASAPLQNKLRDFLVRPRLRHLLCQQRSSVDLRTLINGGGILLADLGIGRWGESASALAGSFLVARLWHGALSRQSQREEERRDFLLYVDEFQSFLGIGGPFADALAQARALRLSLTIANQHLGQLPREIHDAVSANARNRIVFRCPPSDAAAVSTELAPLQVDALVALPTFQSAARLSLGTGFTMRMLPALPRPRDAAEPRQVLAASAARFGRDVASIDREIRAVLAPSETSEEPTLQRSSS